MSTRIGQGEGGDLRATRDLNRAQGKNVMDKKDNELQGVFAKITMLCDAAELPKIVKDCAKEAYKLCHDEKALKGKSTESIMAAAIFVGCRRADVARTFKEIQSIIHVKTKEFFKTLSIMKGILREKSADGFIKIDTDNMSGAQNLTYIPRFCSHLGLPMQLTTAAEYTAKKCKEIEEIAGKSPITIAVVSIYLNILLFKLPVTAAKVGKILQVTEGTIKSGYKILYSDEISNAVYHTFEQDRVKYELYGRAIKEALKEMKINRMAGASALNSAPVTILIAGAGRAPG